MGKKETNYQEFARELVDDWEKKERKKERRRRRKVKRKRS